MPFTETRDGVSQERFPSAEISHLESNKLLKYHRQYWKNRHWTQVIFREGCINFWYGADAREFPGTREVQLRNTIVDDSCEWTSQVSSNQLYKPGRQLVGSSRTINTELFKSSQDFSLCNTFQVKGALFIRKTANKLEGFILVGRFNIKCSPCGRSKMKVMLVWVTQGWSTRWTMRQTSFFLCKVDCNCVMLLLVSSWRRSSWRFASISRFSCHLFQNDGFSECIAGIHLGLRHLGINLCSL